MQLHTGSIPMTDAEATAVAELLKVCGPAASLTRRDPGEQGPIVVALADGTTEVVDVHE